VIQIKGRKGDGRREGGERKTGRRVRKVVL